jgi:hypothetical protein
VAARLSGVAALPSGCGALAAATAKAIEYFHVEPATKLGPAKVKESASAK